jgi:hypothetical protein
LAFSVVVLQASLYSSFGNNGSLRQWVPLLYYKNGFPSWRSSSSSREFAYQAQNSEFKPQNWQQPKQTNKNNDISYGLSMIIQFSIQPKRACKVYTLQIPGLTTLFWTLRLQCKDHLTFQPRIYCWKQTFFLWTPHQQTGMLWYTWPKPVYH